MRYEFDCTKCNQLGSQTFALVLSVGLFYLALYQYAAALATSNQEDIPAESAHKVNGDIGIQQSISGLANGDFEPLGKLNNKARLGLATLFKSDSGRETMAVRVLKKIARAIGWNVSVGFTGDMSEEQVWTIVTRRLNRAMEDSQTSVVLDASLEAVRQSMMIRGNALWGIISGTSPASPMALFDHLDVRTVVNVLLGGALGNLRIVVDAVYGLYGSGYRVLKSESTWGEAARHEFQRLLLSLASGTPALFHFAMLIVHDRLLVSFFPGMVKPCCKRTSKFANVDNFSRAKWATAGAVGTGIALASGQSLPTAAKSGAASMAYGTLTTVFPNVSGLAQDVAFVATDKAGIDAEKIPGNIQTQMDNVFDNRQRDENANNPSQVLRSAGGIVETAKDWAGWMMGPPAPAAAAAPAAAPAPAPAAAGKTGAPELSQYPRLWA